jgi:hypothetical protein
MEMKELVAATKDLNSRRQEFIGFDDLTLSPLCRPVPPAPFLINQFLILYT